MKKLKSTERQERKKKKKMVIHFVELNEIASVPGVYFEIPSFLFKVVKDFSRIKDKSFYLDMQKDLPL